MFTTFALFLQFQLERMGRPKYDYSQVKSGSASAPTLVSPGDDLQSEGLVEWIHDAIYMTWICDILSVVFSSSKVWFYISQSLPMQHLKFTKSSLLEKECWEGLQIKVQSTLLLIKARLSYQRDKKSYRRNDRNMACDLPILYS